MHSEICPVCRGSGRSVRKNKHKDVIENKKCHGCRGKGWVAIPDYRPVRPRPIVDPNRFYDDIHVEWTLDDIKFGQSF